MHDRDDREIFSQLWPEVEITPSLSRIATYFAQMVHNDLLEFNGNGDDFEYVVLPGDATHVQLTALGFAKYKRAVIETIGENPPVTNQSMWKLLHIALNKVWPNMEKVSYSIMQQMEPTFVWFIKHGVSRLNASMLDDERFSNPNNVLYRLPEDVKHGILKEYL